MYGSVQGKQIFHMVEKKKTWPQCVGRGQGVPREGGACGNQKMHLACFPTWVPTSPGAGKFGRGRGRGGGGWGDGEHI